MSGTKKLKDLIIQNKKSVFQVKSASTIGSYPFFTSGMKILRTDSALTSGKNLYVATGGKAFIQYYEGEASYSTDCYSFKTNEEIIEPKFLYYFLYMLTNEINDKMFKGAALKHLQKTDFLNIEVPALELREQKQIIEKLDSLFLEIDKAKLITEANIKNAEALFQSYLKEIFEDNSYEMVKLSSLTDDISDGDHQPPPKASTGIPFITISNVNKITREIDFSNTFKVSREYYDNLKSNRKPAKGDVLYTVTGSFGIPIHIRTDNEFCFQRHIGLIRPSAKVDSRWLYWVVSSPQVFQQAVDSATGAAQLTVSLKALRNFVVPNMPLDIQIVVVQKIEELYQQTRLLADNYRKKSNSLSILKNSALQNIFGSQLVKI